MKSNILFSVLISLFAIVMTAQTDITTAAAKYRRSSLYTMLTLDATSPYADEIKSYFINSPIPDKFNNHNLENRIYTVYLPEPKEMMSFFLGGSKSADVNAVADDFAKKNEKQLDDIAKNLVAKWFNRSAKGGFNMELVKSRGTYDASALDVARSKNDQRGMALLADAGEELISKTFVLVNEFKYVSKEEVAKKASGLLSAFGQAAGAAGLGDISTAATITSAGVTIAGKGYVVKTKGHLYQLKWDEETAAIFYNDFWADDKTITPEKKKAFDETNIFKLVYIGTDDSWADVQSSTFTKKSEVELVQKATMKAMDAVIVKLQKSHDEFKTKTPLFTGEPITAKIGLKEGLSEKSKFDVLEQRQDKNGKTEYVEVGTIKVDTSYPIWDNRYGAEEEHPDTKVDKTYFKKISGKEFYPGMLIVQKKGK